MTETCSRGPGRPGVQTTWTGPLDVETHTSTELVSRVLGQIGKVGLLLKFSGYDARVLFLYGVLRTEYIDALLRSAVGLSGGLSAGCCACGETDNDVLACTPYEYSVQRYRVRSTEHMYAVGTEQRTCGNSPSQHGAPQGREGGLHVSVKQRTGQPGAQILLTTGVWTLCRTAEQRARCRDKSR